MTPLDVIWLIAMATVISMSVQLMVEIGRH